MRLSAVKVMVGMIFVGMLVVGAFPAMGADKVETLRFWMGGSTKEAIKMAEQQIAEFSRIHPETKVYVSAYPWDRYRMKTIQSFTIGTTPDIIWDGQQHKYQALGGITYIDDYWETLPPDVREATDTDMLDALTIDGRLYGVPFGTRTIMVFNNKDMFREAGLDAASVKVLSNDQLLEFAQKLTVDKNGDGQIDQWGVSLIGGRLCSHYFLSVFSGMGGKVLSTLGDFIMPDYRSEIIDTLVFYKKLAEFAPGGAIGALDITYGQNAPVFANGDAAIMMDPSVEGYVNVTLLNPEMRDKIGYFVSPSGLHMGDSLLISTAARENGKMDGTWELVKYLIQPQVEVPMVALGGYAPARSDVLNQPLVEENPGMMAALRQVAHRTMLHPSNARGGAAWTEMRPHLWDAVAFVLLNEKTPEQAADDMLREMMAISARVSKK